MDLIGAAIAVDRALERKQRVQQVHQAAQAAEGTEADPLAEALAAEIGGPGRIVPGEQATEREAVPGDRKHVLNETAEFVAKYLCATPAQVDAMTLYAAATYALQAFPTFGRMLFTSEQEASGKTVAMMITAALSANPLDASGTSYALQSALASASNTPEQLTPTLYLDEVSEVFGKSGLIASRNPVAEILRKGYKAGAARSWSVNRTAEQYSIYTPFIMAGLRNAVPRDIRTRCIVVVMRPGSPRAYFDAREAEPDAQALAGSLGQAVATRITDIAAFRARGVHPRLRDRHLEVWEGLFAVAYILGGQEWLNRCLAAFRELALAESDLVTLSPRQQVLRDSVMIIDGPLAEMAAAGFVGGLTLRDEMRRLPDRPLYAPRSPAGMSSLICDAMMPVVTSQKRVDGQPVRGYLTYQIREAWEAIRPPGMEDASLAEEIDPLEATDEDYLAVTGVTGEAGEEHDKEART